MRSIIGEHKKKDLPTMIKKDVTFKDLALHMKKTGWAVPPLPDRFLHAYLNGDLDSEEMEIMKRKTSRDKNLAKRLKLDFV